MKFQTLTFVCAAMSAFFLGLSIKQTGDVPRAAELGMAAFCGVLAAIFSALV